MLVELGATPGMREARRAQAFARLVVTARTNEPAFGIPIAGAASVLVPLRGPDRSIDCDTNRAGRLAACLLALAQGLPGDPPPATDAREHEIRVRWGGEDGPDLAAVASEVALSAEGVVAALEAADLEVLFLGFAPGFAYIGGLPDALAVPRLATPRVRVPAGSVAIAGGMAGIYPHASPGGWRLLGRTDDRLFDPAQADPVLLRPGDHIRLRAR